MAPVSKPTKVAAADPLDVSPAPSGAGEITTALKPTETTNEIRNADFLRLKAVLAQVKINLELSKVAVAQLRVVVRKHEPSKSRSAADIAFDQVREREQALRVSIAQAANAPADVAAAFQAQVAADYEAYARAVAAAESVARSTGAMIARAAAE